MPCLELGLPPLPSLAMAALQDRHICTEGMIREFHVPYPILLQPSLTSYTVSLPLPRGQGEPLAHLPWGLGVGLHSGLGRVGHNGSGLEEEAAAFPFVRLHWGWQ